MSARWKAEFQREVQAMCGCCSPARPEDQEKAEPKVKEQEKAEKKEPVRTR